MSTIETLPLPGGSPLSEGRALAEALEELRGYARLERNWDGEDGLPPGNAAVQAAAEILAGSYALAPRNRVRWTPPTIAPTPEGGIDLSWEADGGWLMLMIDHDPVAIRCVARRPGQPSHHLAVTSDEAVGTVLAKLPAE